MDKKHRFSFPAVGGSSLLVIFAVLCLTVFALLCLSTVQAGQRLSSASAEAVEAYYLADAEAESVLACLRAGEMPAGVTAEADHYHYECPISETRSLQVEVRLDGENYEVLRWQAVSTVEWETDDSLLVWGGEMEEELP